MKQYHKTNPTGLVHIDRKSVTVNLDLDQGSGVTVGFTVTELDLESYSLPGAARLIVVAYTSHKKVRAELGSVDKPQTGKQVRLDMPDAHAVTFRLIVHEKGSPRLLASCEAIRATRDEENEATRLSLLTVHYVKGILGERLWRLDAPGGEPILLINDDVPYIRHKMEAHDPWLRGLIVPEAFEQALVCWVEHRGSDDGDDHWTNRWERYLDQIGADEPPSSGVEDPKETKDWARETTGKFVDQVRVRFMTEVARQEVGND